MQGRIYDRYQGGGANFRCGRVRAPSDNRDRSTRGWWGVTRRNGKNRNLGTVSEPYEGSRCVGGTRYREPWIRPGGRHSEYTKRREISGVTWVCGSPANDFRPCVLVSFPSSFLVVRDRTLHSVTRSGVRDPTSAGDVRIHCGSRSTPPPLAVWTTRVPTPVPTFVDRVTQDEREGPPREPVESDHSVKGGRFTTVHWFSPTVVLRGHGHRHT